MEMSLYRPWLLHLPSRNWSPSPIQQPCGVASALESASGSGMSPTFSLQAVNALRCSSSLWMEACRGAWARVTIDRLIHVVLRPF